MEGSDRQSFDQSVRQMQGLFRRLSDEQSRDRGALAGLRKGLGEPGGWHPHTAMVIDRAIGESQPRPDDMAILYTVAGLFSLHPLASIGSVDGKRGSLLQSLQALMRLQGRTTADDRAAMDRRVMALLDADRADLPHHLRQLIQQFRGTDIPIDWVQLAHDMRNWSWADRQVQRRWSRDWWYVPPANTDAETPETVE